MLPVGAQVRASALRSLCAYPLELQEELGVLPALARLTQRLIEQPADSLQVAVADLSGGPATSTAATDAIGSAADISDAVNGYWEQAVEDMDSNQQLSAAERLAVLALTYEHDNRRKFFAQRDKALPAVGATALPGGDGSGGGAVGPAASAPVIAVKERDVASLRYRLLSVAPSAIQQQATAALSSSGGGGAVGSRGAVSVAVALPASAAALLLVHKPKAGLAHGSKGE
jgi:hypothetical protein